MTYVGSATSSEHDQELDSLLVGPIPIGVNKFIFEADPPSLARLPSSEILGVTVILLTCSYDSREFVRVGYYVNNEYDSEELNAEPPAKPVIERVRRNVLAEKPRVTRFAIKWDSEDSAPAEYPPEQPEADTLDDDGAAYGAEEAELQAALERELEDTEAKLANVKAETATDGDSEMGGTEQPEPASRGDEEGSEAESEDLEAESSGSEDEEEEEGDGEGEVEGAEGNEDMEMGEGENEEKRAGDGTSKNGEQKPIQQQGHAEVMVH